MNRLSAEAERHWYRLLLLADDHGCLEATPAIVRGKCYALQLDKVSDSDIAIWQNDLGTAKILGYWIYEMRIYGVFLTFDKHNTRYSVTEEGKTTRHRRKTPKPPDAKELCQSLPVLATTLCPLPITNPNPNPGLKIASQSCDKAAKRLDPHEELRREDLTKVVEIITKWDCMKNAKNPYGIAGKLVEVYKGDPVFTCEVLRQKSDIFGLCKDSSHLIASATATYQRASDIRDIESASHRIDDGSKRGGGMKSIKDVIGRNE